MTEQERLAFERAFERRLVRYSAIDVPAIDPVVEARRAMREPRSAIGRLADWRPAGWPMIRLVLIASVVLLTAFATLWLVAGGQTQRPSLVEAVPSTSPSGVPLNVQLGGRWIATAPSDLAISDLAVIDPFVLAIEGSGRQAYLESPDGGLEKLLSDVSADGRDVLRFVKRPGQTEAVTAAGQELGACSPGDEGTYHVVRSSDGLRLTLDTIADACASRAAVLARTWIRSLGGPSTGGTGVIDALDRHFIVTLPPGSYQANRFPGGFAIQQPAPEFEFLAWKEPQGFNDPCNPVVGGRRPIADAADFVQYFRELPGFTVDSVTATEIDGRPATNLRLHANEDASCPDGRLAEWQPEELAAGSRFWFLRPGDADSLYLVDLADTTLMFQVLASSQDLERQIIPSIRILEDGLPTSP